MSEGTAPPELQAAVKAHASVSDKKKGTILFHRGDPGLGIFLILRGEVSVTLDGKDSLYPQRKLGSGAIVGLPATLSGGAYSLGAEVSKDAQLAFVSRQDFLEILAKDTNLCVEAMHLLGNEITSIRAALVSQRGKKSGFVPPQE
jgi:CRP-like cAMP-binding protein